jgi:hypothetical protein
VESVRRRRPQLWPLNPLPAQTDGFPKLTLASVGFVVKVVPQFQPPAAAGFSFLIGNLFINA